MIELLITIALAMYFLAYYFATAKKRLTIFFPIPRVDRIPKYPRALHITIACIAFVIDMVATYLMMQLDVSTGGLLVIVHTILTLVAVSFFVIQAAFGILKLREQHKWFATRIFLPMWVVSYLSGFLFLI